MGDLGYSSELPITVGGGLVFGGFNADQYLRRLRASSGEGITSQRVGSTGGEPILDIYDVRSAGFGGSVILYLNSYAPGPNGVPEGFQLLRPEEPWALPTSIVPNGGERLAVDVPARPRTWRIVGAGGVTHGRAEWDGARAVHLDLPEPLLALMRKNIDAFLRVSPPEYLGLVLEDVFERFLPLHSDHLLKGVPTDSPAADLRLAGSARPSGARRRWPLRGRGA